MTISVYWLLCTTYFKKTLNRQTFRAVQLYLSTAQLTTVYFGHALCEKRVVNFLITLIIIIVQSLLYCYYYCCFILVVLSRIFSYSCCSFCYSSYYCCSFCHSSYYLFWSSSSRSSCSYSCSCLNFFHLFFVLFDKPPLLFLLSMYTFLLFLFPFLSFLPQLL